MNHQDKYHQLFALTEQFIPIMKGELDLHSCSEQSPATRIAESGPHPYIVAGDPTAGMHLQALYQYWERAHPEAGHPYWLTRSWLMCIWQPVYLAMFSVYVLKAVPNLQSLTQHYTQGVVAGYRLTPDDLTQGDDTHLIQVACEHLAVLVEQFLIQFNTFTRLRPGFTRPLLADSVLEALAGLANHFPDAAPADLQAHARQWLAALALASRHLDSLIPVEQSQANPAWQVARISCCMHYRRHDGKLCANCPRAKTPEAKKANVRTR